MTGVTISSDGLLLQTNAPPPCELNHFLYHFSDDMFQTVVRNRYIHNVRRKYKPTTLWPGNQIGGANNALFTGNVVSQQNDWPFKTFAELVIVVSRNLLSDYPCCEEISTSCLNFLLAAILKIWRTSSSSIRIHLELTANIRISACERNRLIMESLTSLPWPFARWANRDFSMPPAVPKR